MAELDKNGADMTIEETFAALDDLIGRLEGGKGSLEDAFKKYGEGMLLGGGPAEEEDDGTQF